MRHLLLIIVILNLAAVSFAQKQTKPPTPTPTVEEIPQVDENQEFQNARAHVSLSDKINALVKFTKDFPESELRIHALELIVSSRAALGDQKLRLSDNEAGINLFRLAVEEAPVPISDKFFSEIIVQFPTNLFFRSQREAAYEIAKMIERKVSANPTQLLGLAAFYLGVEDAVEGKRLAEKAISIDPESASGYQTLGVANRLNFDIEASAAAYAKALELNPQSITSKRNLAEMRRATGRSDDAVTLFREVLDADPTDRSARTGLILSLFNADRKAEAEIALNAALETDPENLFLLVGAAYWYAAHQQSDKAIEFAEKAIKIEPRYTWAHIALARGLLQKKKPLEAERTLLMARQYGNFPTLSYEIAAARIAAGLFREAGDELRSTFGYNDGEIFVNLGGRVSKNSKSFIELLAFERRASIFEPVAADDPKSAEKLKELLRFSSAVAANADDSVSEAAEEFVSGEDNMKIHRGLFVANILLEKDIGLPVVLKTTEFAIGKVDSGLEVASPASTIMADGLYETRTLAAQRNELLIVPDVPKQTLSKILRGRIEELYGWALLKQEKPEDAAIHLKRAISILPEKSAWWRSSNWRLGDSLEAAGKLPEALNAYLSSYDVDAPNPAKRLVIELVYEKVNGTREGLDKLIGADPSVAANRIATPTESPEENLKTDNEPPTSGSKVENGSTDNGEKTVSPSESLPNSQKLVFPENVPAVESTPKIQQTEETISTAASKPETKTETKAADQDPAAEKQTNPPKSIFDPIIISVSSSEKKPKKAESDAANVEQPKSEDDTARAGSNVTSRPRIVAQTPQSESEEPAPTPCALKVSEDKFSILNDGGSLGMFVGFEGEGGDLAKIVATSSSPDDVRVEILPGVGVLTERVFYLIKSYSTKTGVFTVTFDSACGKKDVAVSVR